MDVPVNPGRLYPAGYGKVREALGHGGRLISSQMLAAATDSRRCGTLYSLLSTSSRSSASSTSSMLPTGL